MRRFKARYAPEGGEPESKFFDARDAEEARQLGAREFKIRIHDSRLNIVEIPIGTEARGMSNEDLRAEMKVRVSYNGSLQPAKVLGPVAVRDGAGKIIEIKAWTLKLDSMGIDIRVTADKIWPAT